MPRVQLRRDLAQGDVRHLGNQRQDFLGMGLDPVRTVVPALRPGPDIARPPHTNRMRKLFRCCRL